MTTTFCCGAECEVSTSGALPSPSQRHWTGSNAVIIGPGRNGGKAFRFNTLGAADDGWIRRDVTAHTIRVIRAYIKFDTLPNTDCTILQMKVDPVGDGDSPRIDYNAAAHTITAQVGGTATGATPMVVVAGVWYRIDWKGDVSANPRTSALKVDGVDKGVASKAVVACTASQINLGVAVTFNNVLADVSWDDIVMSAGAAGDYPFGAGQIVGLVPTADGVHSFGATGRFRSNDSADLAQSTTQAFSFINHRLSSINAFLATGAGLLAGEYLEIRIGGMPAADTVRCVEVVSAHHAPNTSANKQSLRMVDGVSTDDVITDSDFSQITLCYNSKHYPTKPSGGAWTTAILNALKFRWASSFTAVDVSPSAYLDGIVVEVDYAAASSVTVNLVGGELRISYAIPEGLDGFDRRVNLDPDDRARLGLHLGVPTFKVTNPDTGGAEPTVDPTFTCKSVIRAARDRHASFDSSRHPDPILVRRLDQLQRYLLTQAIERNPSFMAATHTITWPPTSFDDGYQLAFSYHLLHGGDVFFGGQKTEFNLIEYGRRFSSVPLYSGWVVGDRLYFRGLASDWTGTTKIVLTYVPAVPRLATLGSLFTLPRSAESAFVDNLAAFMGGRGHADPQLPAINVGLLNQEAGKSEEAFLREIGKRRQTSVKYVKDVW
jgi:hypothetical protein